MLCGSGEHAHAAARCVRALYAEAHGPSPAGARADEPSAQPRARCAGGAQGAAVFLAGNALQLHSHWLLARLRPARPAAARDPAAAPDPDAGRGAAAAGGYRLPRGGAFELVSCPHYLAEIVIYAGLALVAGRGRLLPWLVLAWVVRARRWKLNRIISSPNPNHDESTWGIVWTAWQRLLGEAVACMRGLQVANLLLAAGPTHSWYRRHFKDYPARRRAIIPFV